MHIFLLEQILRLGVDIIKSKKHISWMKISMNNTIIVQKCEGLQGLLEGVLGHLWRIMDLHSPPARLEFRQVFNRGTHAATHGLEYKALLG